MSGLNQKEEQYLSDTEVTINTREGGCGKIEEQCPNCGSWYSRISLHWSTSSCDYPFISYEQWEMMKGLMMGDGSLRGRNRKNQSMSITNTNLRFIEYLKNKFGWMFSSFKIKNTSKEKAVNDRSSNFDPDVKMENRYDLYRLITRAHPQINYFNQWWSDGELKFPRLEFTPKLLRMWYVSDGGINYDVNSRIRFTSLNESDRPQNIVRNFENIGFECHHVCGRDDFCISTPQTEDFFDYIGHDPVPGFEYKWAYQDKDRYKRLKEECKEKHKTQTFEIRN